MASVSVRILEQLADVPSAQWDALLTEASTPFMRWSWLEALEHSRCAAPRAGWTPRHLTLWVGDRLLAAAPAYLKEDSDGDFSRDWGWASAASRAGRSFYPKLVLTVPFTPVGGQRVLVAQGEDRAARVKEIVRAAYDLADNEGCGAIEVLYPDEAGQGELVEAGLEPRVDFQYHWHNPGYPDTEAFLARFNSKHRNMIKRERAAPAKQGIALRTVRGDEIARDPERWAKVAHTLHRSTVDKLMWGRRWLNQAFYTRMFAAMPESVEVVVASREEQVVAGAFNVASGDRLFGRYWGCLEEHPFLHFNVCYYHSIDECIRRRTRVFEGGAGGEHKIARGFEPSFTYGAFGFTDAKLDAALRRHLREEKSEREAVLARWRDESPLFKRAGS
jgi:predicted N-acyltransferase